MWFDLSWFEEPSLKTGRSSVCIVQVEKNKRTLYTSLKQNWPQKEQQSNTDLCLSSPEDVSPPLPERRGQNQSVSLLRRLLICGYIS